MKHAGRMKPKRKARESHDEFYSPFARWAREAKVKQNELEQTDGQIPSRESQRAESLHHVRGMQLGSSASMLSFLYEVMETTKDSTAGDDDFDM